MMKNVGSRSSNMAYTSLQRIVVAVDPAVSSNPDSDETGIIVVGMKEGVQKTAYVLEDLSLKATPFLWARRVVEAYHTFNADRVVAEVNQGGRWLSHF